MAGDLLHAHDTRSGCWTGRSATMLGKGVKKYRVWTMSVTRDLGQARRQPARSTHLRRTGRKNTSHRHPAKMRGILQADGHKGYAKPYDPDPDGTPRLREAARWAHLRRDLHDERGKTRSVIAREAMDRIGAR
jgi:transposase